MSGLPGLFPSGTLFEGRQAGGLSFLTNEKDETNQTVYTFSDVTIGQPQDDRRIIVAVHTVQSSEGAISGVTIGGIAADIHLNINSASTAMDTDLAIVSALVPDGTAADIVITNSNGRDTCLIGVWSLYGETDSSPFATASDTVISGFFLETTIDIPEGGALIAATVAGDTSSATVIWSTTIDEKYDNYTFPMISSGASRDGLEVEAGRTIQAVYSDSPNSGTPLLAVISWQYT